jgi:hypothetical protein
VNESNNECPHDTELTGEQRDRIIRQAYLRGVESDRSKCTWGEVVIAGALVVALLVMIAAGMVILRIVR